MHFELMQNCHKDIAKTVARSKLLEPLQTQTLTYKHKRCDSINKKKARNVPVSHPAKRLGLLVFTTSRQLLK